MSTFVFVGPTLPAAEVDEVLPCTRFPPVAQGDVYRASLLRPHAIVLLDGYFDHVCAVWHKEILWAMRQGVHVFGAASMGALRAAELHPFGMIGVGLIYEAFRDGALEDDDEVAVLHGPAESEYRVVTDAMVNVRATLHAAVAEGVIGSGTGDALTSIAKALHYTVRRYGAVLDAAREDAAVDPTELTSFATWLPGGAIDQKQEDALAVLRHVEAFMAGDAEPNALDMEFEYTTLFDNLRREAGAFDVRAGTAGARLFTEAVLNEARLSGLWPELRRRAIARRLALEDGRRQRLEVGEADLIETVIALREERGLIEPEDLDAWLEANNLRGADFVSLVRDETTARRIHEALEPEIVVDILDLLRLDGRYPELADRALAKQPLFAAIDADPPDAEVYRQARTRLLRRIQDDHAPDTDPLGRHGFATPDAFDRAAIGEFLFEREPSRA